MSPNALVFSIPSVVLSFGLAISPSLLLPLSVSRDAQASRGRRAAPARPGAPLLLLLLLARLGVHLPAHGPAVKTLGQQGAVQLCNAEAECVWTAGCTRADGASLPADCFYAPATSCDTDAVLGYATRHWDQNPNGGCPVAHEVGVGQAARVRGAVATGHGDRYDMEEERRERQEKIAGRDSLAALVVVAAGVFIAHELVTRASTTATSGR